MSFVAIHRGAYTTDETIFIYKVVNRDRRSLYPSKGRSPIAKDADGILLGDPCFINYHEHLTLVTVPEGRVIEYSEGKRRQSSFSSSIGMMAYTTFAAAYNSNTYLATVSSRSIREHKIIRCRVPKGTRYILGEGSMITVERLVALEEVRS